MTATISWLLFLLIGGVAAMHVYWASGGYWPAQQKDELAKTVVGAESEHMPPAFVTLIVAVLIFLVGCLPLLSMGAIHSPIPKSIELILMAGATIVFLTRGLVTYLPIADRYSVVEPFVTFNRRYYSPLCVVLAIGFAFVMLAG